jgi:hypothetical protein
MRRGRLFWLILWLLGWASSGAIPARAQEDDPPVLKMMQTAFGTLDAETTELRWQFEGQAGQSVSVLAQRLSGDLDPTIEVIDTRGRRLVEGDDIAYPDQLDAALEAIELPRDGMYTLRVASYEGEATAGEFALSLLPAYADPVLRDDFSGEPMWQVQGDQAESSVRNGQLTLTVTAANATPWAAPDMGVSLPNPAYVQVQAEVTNTPDYWEYGLVLPTADEGSYYQFSVSSRGDWAFQARQGETWEVIHDWSDDQAVDAIDGPAALGVRVDGDTFTFYLNGAELGSETSDLLGPPAGFGLSAGSIDQQETLPEVRFSDLLVTAPLPTAEEASGEAPLEAWQARDSAAVVAELAARGVISEGGQQVMLVPESFTSTALPGIQSLGLGQGRTQTDFVMSANLSMESDSAENACGLIFRQESDDHYGLFFADGLGGLGLAEWRAERFDPAFYTDQRPTDAGEPADGLDHVILVAYGDSVRVYLNGALVMNRAYPAVSGGVAIAALSYDGTFVNCRFGDTWLWTWD